MLGRKPKIESTQLQPAIDMILKEMDEHGTDNPEYPTLLENLERLYALQHPKGEKSRIDINTVIITVGPFLTAFLIVAYEQHHVVTSKAMDFVRKPR